MTVDYLTRRGQLASKVAQVTLALGNVYRDDLWDSRSARLCYNEAASSGHAPVVVRAQEALAKHKMVGIAPECTRSGDGRLGKGLPGIVLLAQRTGAPILPIACWGHEDFWKNMTHFRRTDFFIGVGQPFTLKLSSGTLSKDVREQVTQEIMYQISMLLPERYRGVYADMDKITTEYLDFAI